MARPRESNRHLPKYVYEHHGAWWFRPPSGDNCRICEVGDYPTLYRFMADKAEPVSNAELTTLRKCFARYEREVLPTLAPRTQKDYRRALRVLDAEFGDRHPNAVQPKDVGRFLDVPTGKVHRNRMVAVLSAVYAKCVGKWYVADKNPCVNVERNETHRRTRYITDDEYALVWNAMPPRIRIAMDLALLTGQRQGDLLRLKWSDVTPDGIRFAPAKTAKKVGKRLLVERSPAIDAVLARAHALLPEIPKDYVIRQGGSRRYPKKAGQPYTSEGFRAVWQRRMRKLCKGYLRKRKGHKPTWHPPALASRFTFHDIRAKAVSDSGSLEEAFERAGHTSMTMTRSVYDRGERRVKPLR